MKYSVLSFNVLFALLVFVVSSCDKDKTTATTTSNNNKNSMPQVAPGGGNGGGTVDCCKNYTTYFNMSENEWCCTEGTNCAACVTIEGSSQLIADFEAVIVDGPTSIQSYFSGDEYIELFPALEDNPEGMLTKLQSGNYTIEKLISPSDENHVIYKASNSEGDYFGLPLYLLME